MENSAWLLMAMVFLTGLRHGFDLDHLATIDSITRTVSNNRNLARMAGILFSFGHGLVVIAISVIIGCGLMPATVPQWLNRFGGIISITFLFAFGLLTLFNVFRHPSQSGLPTSLKKYLAGKLIRGKINPAFITGIGILFAFSFDTVSLVILFSLTATAMAGWWFSGLLGIVFMMGMMMTDGLNGLLVAILVQRADRASFLLSRMAGLMIASFSLIIAVINCVKLTDHA